VQSESFSCCLTGFVFRFLSSFFFWTEAAFLLMKHCVNTLGGSERANGEGQRGKRVARTSTMYKYYVNTQTMK